MKRNPFGLFDAILAIAKILLLAVLAWLSLGRAAVGAEYGYSVLDSGGLRGNEIRATFGDRFALALGSIDGAVNYSNDWIDTPYGCCYYADNYDNYQYVSLTHRWYTGRKRFFFGTGAVWRNAHTCTTWFPGVAETCWDGTPGVSSQWALRQSFGVRWNWLEVAIDHDSTAGRSVINHGDNAIRITFFPLQLGKNGTN